jgi:uncharacterized protein YggE
MTRRARFGLVAGLLVVGFAACGGSAPAAGPSTTASAVVGDGAGTGVDRPAITASGVGRASGPPDSMVVSFNVHTDAASAAETMDQTSLRTEQLLTTAREQGVADEDLRTTSVNVYPRFDNAGRRVVGYSSDNSFTITYRDLATAGGLLDQLVGVGGDFLQVQGLFLQLDDPTAVLEEARADAVARAQAQAQQLADAAGVELGPVRRIVEVPVGSSGFQDDGVLAGAGAPARDVAVSVPIAGGGQEVTVQVQLVYDVG